MAEGVIQARDQNKVFVERAYAKPMSPREAEDWYLLAPGKGNAYIELNVGEDELQCQANRLTGRLEFFIRGHVLLAGREAVARDNG